MRRGFLLGSNAASSADTGARASGPSTGAAQAREDERPSTGAAAEVSVTDEEPLTFNPHPKKPRRHERSRLGAVQDEGDPAAQDHAGPGHRHVRH